MVIDDLRNETHALARDLHEYDVDLQQAAAQFEARLEALSTRLADLSVALQNYSPAGLLRLAARGRATYAKNAPPDQAAILDTEANAFTNAARLVDDPSIIGLLIPSWMPIEPG